MQLHVFWPFSLKLSFCDFLFASLDEEPVQIGVYFQQKKFAPQGVNSFLSELTYIVKEGKTKLYELLPLKVYQLLVSFLSEARAPDKRYY